MNSFGLAEDIVVFQRRQDSAAIVLAKQSKRNSSKVVFDLSVNYLTGEKLSGRPYGSSSLQRDNCLRMMDLADVVTCSSSELARLASGFHPNVQYVPDSINFAHFSAPVRRETEDDDEISVVWSGVSSKIVELSPLFPVLRARKTRLIVISESRSGVRKVMAGSGVKADFRRWTYRSFPQKLTAGNLSISIKDPESPYENANSSFKILAPMAMGIPVLGSPIPAYREALASGGGELCDSVGHFESWLEYLRENPSERKILGEQARLSSKAYDHEFVAEKLYGIFASLM